MPLPTRTCMQRGMSSRNGSKRTLDYPFQPVVLAFKDLHYYVPNPAGAGELELLRGVSGVFKPGVLTALMGASGAGKSTLMDVISGAALHLRCCLLTKQ